MSSDLDFWIGEWDCRYGDGIWGSNVVTKSHAGYVILEDWRSPHINGRSVNVYSPQRQRWLQTWVDDHGNYLVFEGGMQGDVFILEQREDASTMPGRFRIRFSHIRPDSLTWDYERADAEGRWTSAWRIAYTRHVRRGPVTAAEATDGTT